MKKGLSIRKISYHLPKKIQTNEQLKVKYPHWNVDQVQDKTGILQRYISDHEETSLDLGVSASRKFFNEYGVSREEIDALLFVSQTPDYALPPSSCILQEKLSLRQQILALDINLGCSGFVNSLALASSLIKSNTINNCLIICAETYSKYIKKMIEHINF